MCFLCVYYLFIDLYGWISSLDAIWIIYNFFSVWHICMTIMLFDLGSNCGVYLIIDPDISYTFWQQNLYNNIKSEENVKWEMRRKKSGNDERSEIRKLEIKVYYLFNPWSFWVGINYTERETYIMKLSWKEMGKAEMRKVIGNRLWKSKGHR